MIVIVVIVIEMVCNLVIRTGMVRLGLDILIGSDFNQSLDIGTCNSSSSSSNSSNSNSNRRIRTRIYLFI